MTLSKSQIARNALDATNTSWFALRDSDLLIAGIPNHGQGGIISAWSKADYAKLLSNLVGLQPDQPKRVILFDNAKGLVFGQEIESLITSSEIDGHALYRGHASRPNAFIWAFSGNHLRTSNDMATRLITIRIRRPEYARMGAVM